MTVKEEIYQLVESFDDTTAAEALDYLRWLASDGDTLSADELAFVRRGEDEIARGDFVTLAELLRTSAEMNIR